MVDPRAGHGPGIGGFKADSEIGVAFKAGHPCYFIGFLPEPMPGQTLEDIARAEAVFIEKVIELHPKADGKPCVIGNCQAGWAIMMLAAHTPGAVRSDNHRRLAAVLLGGRARQEPMRYSGGLLGGSWLTALTGDLGHGKFDGAWLVQNFENQNPANTLWTKRYNLYSKIDTEAPRYLGFERWWGGHVNLNAAEIQAIVDELFIGNKLASGGIRASDGTAIDLRNIRSPIVVFCSKGDNVTPPQQALGWILDLYENVDDIRAYGQTIVYTIHEIVGHLGIFVSAGVARKEHDEFSSNIDLIDVLPPGLYEAVLEAKRRGHGRLRLVAGEWVMRCEERTLDDIRALGGNDAADERRFATAARVSEINLALYRTFAQPVVRAMTSAAVRRTRCGRCIHCACNTSCFSDANPLMGMVKGTAERARDDRRPVAADNPFLALQETMSKHIVAGLDAWREMTEAASERMFLSVYGSPALQAAVGIDPSDTRRPRKAETSAFHRELLQSRVAELKSRIPAGGLRECLVRGLLYVGMARGSADERGLAALRGLRAMEDDQPRPTLSEFKALVRAQYYMLLIDQEATLSAIPDLLPRDYEARRKGLAALRRVLGAAGELTGETARRLERVAELFAVQPETTSVVHAKPRLARAS